MFSKAIKTHCPICSEPLYIKNDSERSYYRYKCEGDEDHSYELMNCTLPHTEYVEEYRIGKYYVFNDSHFYSHIELDDQKIVCLTDGTPYIPVFKNETLLEEWLKNEDLVDFIK